MPRHEGRWHVIEAGCFPVPRHIWGTYGDPVAAIRAAAMAHWLAGSRVEVWDKLKRVRVWSWRRNHAERTRAGGLPALGPASEKLPTMPRRGWLLPGHADDVPMGGGQGLLGPGGLSEGG